MSNNLGVLLITCPNYMDKLQANFSIISSQNRLPGNLSIQFEARTDLIVVNSPVTHFGTEMENDQPPTCVFPHDYFLESTRTQEIMLFHELVHAFQRQDVLLNWNKSIREKLREYQMHIQAIRQMDTFLPPTQRKEPYSQWLFEIIKSYYDIIFEAWNDLYFKENYDDLFESDMNIIFERISDGTERGVYDHWANNQIFNIFKQLLRSTYLSKITTGFDIRSNFQELSQFWKKKLSDVSKNNQFSVFQSYVNPLTEVTLYPNPIHLEKRYLEFGDSIWKGSVFG